MSETKAFSVTQFKRNALKVLSEAKAGNDVVIFAGRAKKPVAKIVPFQEEMPKKRPLGFLKGIVKLEFKDDWEMTAEDLLDLKD